MLLDAVKTVSTIYPAHTGAPRSAVQLLPSLKLAMHTHAGSVTAPKVYEKKYSALRTSSSHAGAVEPVPLMGSG